MNSWSSLFGVGGLYGPTVEQEIDRLVSAIDDINTSNQGRRSHYKRQANEIIEAAIAAVMAEEDDNA